MLDKPVCMFLEKCRPLTSDSLDLKCTLDGKIVDCSMPSTPGTTLTPSCKVTHSIPNGGVESPVELLCLPNGEWRGALYTCTPSKCLFYFLKCAKFSTALKRNCISSRNQILYFIVSDIRAHAANVIYFNKRFY